MKPNFAKEADSLAQPSASMDKQGQRIKASGSESQRDQILQRANEFVSLHYDVKLRHLETGPDPELVKAGRDVNEVIAALNKSQ